MVNTMDFIDVVVIFEILLITVNIDTIIHAATNLLFLPLNTSFLFIKL